MYRSEFSLAKLLVFFDFVTMKPVLNLASMTKAEKLQAMEELWQDLSRVEEDVESPEWHLDVLKDREARLDKGEDEFMSWESAKEELRKRKK